jgi:2-deoxy-D-gluconate 3-dehydrogenase
MQDWLKRFSLNNKWALVTGATKGIGNTTSLVLADAGANLILVGREQIELDKLKIKIKAMGRSCITIAADIQFPNEIDMIADRVFSEISSIDILVNNAGISMLDSLLQIKINDWDKIMEINLRAPMLLAQKFVPGMIKKGHGKIINISSQSGVNALENHGAYCSSKGGLNMLTKVMAVEWASHNIQINAICPNVILTPMGEKVWGDPEKGGPMKAKTPARRFGTPTEVADMVLYLASDASNYVCGDIMMIDGGYTAI